jgi:hypothetical protein
LKSREADDAKTEIEQPLRRQIENKKLVGVGIQIFIEKALEFAYHFRE